MSSFVIDYFATVGRNLSERPVLKDVVDLDSETAWQLIPNAIFPSTMLGRYPDQNHSGQTLPEAELAMFIFPHGLQLKYSTKKRFPIPVYFTFVFTDEKGAHIYTACLKFYEKMSNQEVANFFKYTDEKFISIPDNVTFYCPKAICLVSSQPFYRPMRSFLGQIYSMSLSSLPCPLEFYIASLIGKVPMPTPGGRPFQFIQDVGLMANSARSLPMIEFQLPHREYYSFLDLDFSAPLRCMSIANLLIVFALMLREARIVFVANSNNMLAETMEVLRHLLFPLTWSSTYVSRLPHSLTGLFEALGGFLIGVNIKENSCVDDQSEWHPFNEMTDNSDFDWMDQLVTGTYLVDLTSNRIYCVEREGILPMPLADKTALISAMPAVPFKRIQEHLTKVCTSQGLGPQKSGFEIFDNAFEYQALDDTQEFPTLGFRDMFLMLMVDIMGDYPKYVSSPSSDFSADTFRTFKECFSVEEYVNSADPNVRPLLSALVETQMFGYFIQQRIEGADPKLLFFERAAGFLRETGVCSVPGKKSTAKTGILVAPVHESLEADMQLRYHSALTTMELEHSAICKASSQLIGVAADPAFNPSSRKKNSSNRQFTPTSLNLKEGDFITFFLALKQQHEVDIARRNPSTKMAAQRRRSELSIMNVDDLHLHDKLAGPILIPGQLSIELPEEIIELMNEFGDAHIHLESYDGTNVCSVSYPLGWPMLHSELFEAFRSPADARLKDILNLRKAEYKALSSGICTLTRSQYERTPFYYRCMTPFLNSLETNAIAAAILDLYSTSMLMLSVRVKLLVKPVSDILQMLGILAEIEEKGLLSFVDEPVWRSLLLSCAWTGGSFMRQLAWTVYEIIQTLHVPFGAATYGAFVRAAVTSELSKFESFAGNQIDPFMYLEEMGLAWFLQRYAISESLRKSVGKSSSAATQASPAKWSYLPSSSWFRRSDQPTVTTIDTQMSVLVNAATYTANYLSLDRQYAGVINCYQPRHFMWLVAPIHVSIYSYPLSKVSPISGAYSPASSPIPGSASGSLVPGAREALVRDLSKRLEKLHNETEATMYSASVPARSISNVDSKRSVTSVQSKLPAPPSTGSLASIETAGNSSGNLSPAKELELSVAHKRWTAAKSEFSDEEGDCSETSGDSVQIENEDSDIDSTVDEGLPVDGIAVLKKRLSSRPSSRRIKNNSSAEPPKSPAKMPISNPGSKKSSPIKLVSSQEQQQQSFRSELDEVKEPMSKLRLDPVPDAEATTGVSLSTSPVRKLPPLDSLYSNEVTSPPPRSPTSRSPQPPGNGLSPNRRLSSTTSSNWVSNLENRILQALKQDLTCVVGMHSRTPCRCGYSLLDDEILAHSMFNFSAWPFSRDGKKVHLPTESQPTSSLTCPQCHSNYSPKLHVRVYGKAEPSFSNSEELTEHWALSVKYLSPREVRHAVEEIVERVGEPVIEPKYMQTYRPDLYWNLIWYGCRVGLPLGFVAIDASTIELFEPESWSPRPAPSRTNLLLLESLKCPVVVAWREDIARVKVRNLFAGRLANDLRLSDVFPQSESEERIAHLQFIAELLDGSLINMKKAIFLYRRYAGLLRHLFRIDGPKRTHSSKNLSPRIVATDATETEGSSTKTETSSGTAAREIFVGLLFLAYFYKKASVAPRINTPTNTTVDSSTTPNATTVAAGTPVVETIPFCKSYLETVRHSLSTLDFQKLRLLKKEMVDSVSSEAVQAARLGFGLLF